jgi:two-component system, cell cycle response regulator CpdR
MVAIELGGKFHDKMVGAGAWTGMGRAEPDERESPMARILLADDDSAARNLVQRALAVDGHAVTCTQDGAEALEQLQAPSARFDVLIADVQMPGVDGITLAEKCFASLPTLRVILISGFADELDRAEHLKSKVARVVAKPITLEGIRAAVREVLG